MDVTTASGVSIGTVILILSLMMVARAVVLVYRLLILTDDVSGDSEHRRYTREQYMSIYFDLKTDAWHTVAQCFVLLVASLLA